MSVLKLKNGKGNVYLFIEKKNKSHMDTLGYLYENGSLGRGWVFIKLIIGHSNNGKCKSRESRLQGSLQMNSLRFHIDLRQSNGFLWVQRPRPTSSFLLPAASSHLLPSTAPADSLGSCCSLINFTKKGSQKKKDLRILLLFWTFQALIRNALSKTTSKFPHRATLHTKLN